MTAITVPIEFELTPRSQAVMDALQKALAPRFVAEEAKMQETVPAIGAPWPGIEGSAYAGISRGEDGAPDAHLVLLGERPDGLYDWDAAVALASDRADGARLPTRFESALLYAHLRDQFDVAKWHWTSTQCSEGTAWGQTFLSGSQYLTGKEFEARVRFVRRFPL